MGCPLTREREQKKKPIFIFKSVCVRLRGNVRSWECVNTEYDWEVKRRFEKASVSRAVRLRECPLAESSLYTLKNYSILIGYKSSAVQVISILLLQLEFCQNHIFIYEKILLFLGLQSRRLQSFNAFQILVLFSRKYASLAFCA